MTVDVRQLSFCIDVSVKAFWAIDWPPHLQLEDNLCQWLIIYWMALLEVDVLMHGAHRRSRTAKASNA